MKLNTFLIAFALMIANPLLAQTSQSYHVDNTVRVNRTNCSSLNQLSVLIPVPQTDQYQTISNVTYNDGQLLSIPNTSNKYVRFLYTSEDISNLGSIINPTVSFDAVLHPFVFDFSQIGTIYPYNTSSDEYQQNIGTSGAFVNPNHPTIVSIAQNIWSSSSDIVDYARRCYEYVAQNFNYLYPNTGLHPLIRILNDGGGDCGNLSSIYVSLLRNKSIPSRHVVTFRPDGSLHVWAEFYLENYGWIPVDVTYKQSDPTGDYFGNYDGNGIVVSKGVYLTLEKMPGISYQCAILQQYEWWYWHSNSNLCTEITSRHIVNSELQNGVDDNNISAKIYPNPTKDKVTIECEALSHIRIVNTIGQTVYDADHEGEQAVIDLSQMAKGIYMMRIEVKGGQVVRKIVIE